MRALARVSRLGRAAYERIAFVAVLACLGSVQLAWALLATLIWRFVPLARGRVIGRRVISNVFRGVFALTARLGVLTVDASALDGLDQSESLVLAPNHPSVLDALILIARLDRLNCIMKASVLDNLLLGAGARLAGYIRNDSPRRMLRLAADELARGGQLIVFPEATRTVTAPVNAFTGGFAVIARRAGVPVQTVFIETDTPFLSKGWSVLKKPPRLPMTFRVRLGRRFEVVGESRAFVDRVHGYFLDELVDAQIGTLQPRPVAEPPRVVDAFPEPSRLDERAGRWSPTHSRSLGS